jgi:hypothetical protein
MKAKRQTEVVLNSATMLDGFGGHVSMEVNEAQEVKQLREENARLKKLVAELSLDKDMLQSVIRKNSLGS